MGGGRAQGGREEGGAEGRRGWGLPRQQSQRLQPPACSLALSARSRLPGSGWFAARAPAGEPEASPAPGQRTVGLAGPSPGHAAEAGRWLGGVHGDQEPRSTVGALGRGVGSNPGEEALQLQD